MVINHSASNSTSSESALTVTDKRESQTEDEEEEELVNCDCCGLTEECTPAYITTIRQRYQGKWICGLCSEAINYEMRFLNTEEALIQHMNFCNQFKSSVPPLNPAVGLISAMRHILKRSVSPRKLTPLKQSETCDPALSSSQLDQNHQEIDNTSRAEF